MLNAPRPATVGLTPNHKASVPVAAQTPANTTACRPDKSPRTKGRFRVRDICASYAGSIYMFSAFADAEAKVVPMVR